MSNGDPGWGKDLDNQWVPFGNGNQLHYPDYHGQDINGKWISKVVWNANEVFHDTLIYEGFERGRSAAYFMFRRKSNSGKVVVFLKDLEPMFMLMQKGRVTVRSGRRAGTLRGLHVLQAGCKLRLQAGDPGGDQESSGYCRLAA